jgi:GntR family transcriptional regulator, histidine utilization repressor
MTTLGKNAALPKYRRIKDSILVRIESGEWAPGTRIPSENTLVRDLNVSRMTVHRALREMTQDGHLERVRGVGTFVAEPPRHASLIELRDIADDIRARGKIHGSRVHLCREESASAEIASCMEVPAETPVFHVLIVHFQDDVPLQVEDRFVNPVLAPRFLETDFDTVTPTQYLLDLYRPDELEHVVRAVLPDEEECAMLAIPHDEPCLRLVRRTWKDSAVVTTVSLLYPGSRHGLSARYAAGAFGKES